MIISRIEDIRNEECLRLIATEGCAFHSPDWLTMYGKDLHLFGIYQDDVLCGAFFLFHFSKGPLKFWSNPPFCPSIGWIYRNNASNTSKILSAEKRAIQDTADFIDNLSGTVMRCSMPVDVLDMQPFIWKNFKVVPGYTYQHQLSDSSEVLLNKISPEHRNLMRKAEKDGVVCRITTDLQLVKKLVTMTFQRKEKSLNETMLDKILFDFCKPGNHFAHIAYNGETPIAATLHIYDNNKSYYLLSGYDPKTKHGGAGILNIWNAMQHSKNLGLKIYDFEGSMLPEVERYFRGFGPQMVPYFTFSKSNFLMEVALKTKLRHIF